MIFQLIFYYVTDYNWVHMTGWYEFGLLPLGFCERKTPNIEKTASIVLSVLLLIYEYNIEN